MVESIIIILNFKELGIKFVVVKVFFEIYRKFLEKVGVDYVVFLEKEMGCEVVWLLIKFKVID